jgi:cell division protein FtsB
MHDEFENLAALRAVGAATPEELRALDGHLADCEACRRAAAEYDEAAASMALGLDGVTPPPDVRRKILAGIAPANVRSIDQSPRRSRRWLLGVAAAIFLVLWGWTEIRRMNERDRVRRIEEQLASLNAERQKLETENQKMAAQIAALASADTRAISLSGQEVAPRASARVFLDQKGRQAFVFFDDLPDNPGDKSYQLWIIPASGEAPMSAGVFDVDENGAAQIVIQNLPVAKEIKALAVTLEPKGGLPAPSGEMYLVGGTS